MVPVRVRKQDLCIHRAVLPFDQLEAQGIHLDALRLRGFPFPEAVKQFVASHEHVFVVEQNRDAQLRGLLIDDLGLAPAQLLPILHFDGTPITARFIARAITEHVRDDNVVPFSLAKSGGKVA